MQGNKKPARNYLGKQKTVKNIPIKWKSGPKAPETELAYITKAEKDLILKKDLHGSLKHGPNTGPDGIMSLDTQGDYTPDRSPGGGGGGGGGDHEAQNIATQQAARQKAVLTGKIQRDPNTGNWEAGRNLGRRENLMGLGLGQGNINIGRSIRGDLRGRRSRLGGIFGALGRGALSIFGGIPGKVMSGILSARNLAKRTGAKIGEFGETDEEGNPLYPTLDRYLNRNTDKYKDKPYRGQGQGYDFSDTGQGNNLGLYKPNEPYVDEGRVGQDQGYYGMGSSYDQTRMPENITNNMGANNQFVEEEETFNMPLPMGSAEGGRIGYERGRVVNPGGYQGMTPFMAWVKDQYGVNVKDIKDWNFYSGLSNEWNRLGGSKAEGGIASLV